MRRSQLKFLYSFWRSTTIPRSSLLKENKECWMLKRKYSSALYLSGRYAKETFAYLTPHLDIDNKLHDVEKLQKELGLRGLNIDASELKKAWNFYKTINERKVMVEEKLTELKGAVSTLMKKADKSPEEQQEFDKLTNQLKVVKEDAKGVKESLWDLDEDVIQKIIKLPNELDKRTPHGSPVVLKKVGNVTEKSSEKKAKSHIEIGSQLGILEYRNPMQYYLCNEGALFELGALGYAGSIFKQDQMIRVAGSDFGRSSLVEGSGLNHENLSDAFVIANHADIKKNSHNGMHLVGGASLISFLALHAKQLINPKHFPLRYFATGRQYLPFVENTSPMGLFTVCQSSAVHTFIVTKEAMGVEHDAEFDSLLDTVCKLYDNICDHYQIVMRSASELRPWEKLRVSFELWSPFIKQYIEVGHISICGDYFGKRLLIMYKTPQDKEYCSVICGTVLSVPRLLGCLLEQDPKKFHVPTKVAEYMPIDR